MPYQIWLSYHRWKLSPVREVYQPCCNIISFAVLTHRKSYLKPKLRILVFFIQESPRGVRLRYKPSLQLAQTAVLETDTFRCTSLSRRA